MSKFYTIPEGDMSKEKKLVHISSLEKVLDSLNLTEKIRNKKVKCHYCDKQIVELEEISFLKKYQGKVIFVCDSLKCVENSARSDNG